VAQNPQAQTTPQMPQTAPTDAVAPTQSLTSDQGPVTDPAGIVAAGGTPDQAKMAGTPAQVQSNAAQQQREQQQQQEAQQQQQQAEQQRLAGQTLQQTQRYQQATETPTQTQQRAMQIAETLNVLGPVKSRVQSLIQDQLQAAQTASASLELNEQALGTIQDPEKRAQAEASLKAYMADPSQENLKNVYEAVGSQNTEDLQKFFSTPEGAVQEAFKDAFQVSPTLESLDLAASGMDTAAIAKELGIPESQLKGMTLDQLNQQIDAVEAAELNRTEQLQAQLQDPSLSPAMREAVVKELQQLGATGVIGAEQQVQQVQDMIDSANTVNIMGREMSVEELLSDDGMSALIAQASTDPEMLDALKNDPQYAALAGWVEENKSAMAALSEGYEERGEDFVETQESYSKLKESLGKDGADLLKSIYGGDLADVATAGEMSDIKAKLEDTPLYRVLTAKGNEEYAAMLKSDPELAKKFMDSGFEDTELEYVFDVKQKMDEGGYSTTLIDDLLGGKSPEGGFVFDQEGMNTLRKSDLIERVDKISPSVMAGAQEAQDAAKKAGLEDGPVLSLDDLETINDADDPDGIMNDVSGQITAKSEFDDKYKVKDEDGNLVFDSNKIMEDLFGFAPVSYQDLQISLESPDLSEENKNKLLAVFDADGDGNISQAELEDTAAGDKLAEQFGLDASVQDIIDKGGDWEIGSVPKLGVTKGAWAAAETADADTLFGDVVDSWSEQASEEYPDEVRNWNDSAKQTEFKESWKNLDWGGLTQQENANDSIPWFKGKNDEYGYGLDLAVLENFPPEPTFKADGTFNKDAMNEYKDRLYKLSKDIREIRGGYSGGARRDLDVMYDKISKAATAIYETVEHKVRKKTGSYRGQDRFTYVNKSGPSFVNQFDAGQNKYNAYKESNDAVVDFGKNYKKLKTPEEKFEALMDLKAKVASEEQKESIDKYLKRYFPAEFKDEKQSKRTKVSEALKGKAEGQRKSRRRRHRGLGIKRKK